jgi:PPM family protein phosphatase
MQHTIISGIGKRESNQDECIPNSPNPNSSFFLVCDGVGGENHGDIASKITSKAVHLYLSQTKQDGYEDIKNAIIYAETALDLYKEKYATGNEMSTTLSLLNFHSDSEATACWVGDSRIYHLRNGEIIYKSVDHSLREYFYQKGIISIHEKENFGDKNVITRSICGTEYSASPDFHKFDNIQKDDFFLICSDGFYEILNKNHFDLFISSAHPELIKSHLNKECLEKSKDNYACHILKI